MYQPCFCLFFKKNCAPNVILSRTNNLHISSDNCVVGVFYGEPKDLSANYRKTDKDFPVYIGRDFWHRLTGDEDFYDILTQNNPIGTLIMR